MPSSTLKPIFLVTEGRNDAPVICALVNMGKRAVYMVVAGGYQSIAATVRTQYLMYGDAYNYIAVFDSDSRISSIRNERLSIVRDLSGANMHSNIGIFCFRNTMEVELGLPKLKGNDMTELNKALKERREQMIKRKTITEIQEFVDKLH